jgi:cellulase
VATTTAPSRFERSYIFAHARLNIRVLQAYLAKVSNATTAVGSSASWFKVYETGLVSDKPDYWATEVMNNNCGHVTFTIPSVASGNYLLRPEVIGSSFVTDPA